MKAIVIGGSGHIGTYLVPMLIENDYEVINFTRESIFSPAKKRRRHGNAVM